MGILPISGLNSLAVTARGGRQGVTDLIKLAVDTTAINPNGSTPPPRVSWHGQVGSCRTGPRITLCGEARGSNAVVVELGAQYLKLGRRAHDAMTGKRSPDGTLPQSVKASSVEDALLRFPHLNNMAQVALHGRMGVLAADIVSSMPKGAPTPDIYLQINGLRLRAG
jgi:hypothetical protein